MPPQESEASCRMLRELCLRSGVLVPPELMQSSSSLAGSASLQVPLPCTFPCQPQVTCCCRKACDLQIHNASGKACRMLSHASQPSHASVSAWC